MGMGDMTYVRRMPLAYLWCRTWSDPDGVLEHVTTFALRDTVGYGFCHIPLVDGCHVLEVPTWLPEVRTAAADVRGRGKPMLE